MCIRDRFKGVNRHEAHPDYGRAIPREVMEKDVQIIKAHALREIITSKDRVLIMGHQIGDVYSFGAAIGIYRIARTLDRKAQIVINEITTSVQPLIDMFQNSL